MERIYMWLSKMDSSVDMLVMVANVYTQGCDFSALSSAYVRVANADTNQEPIVV
jgi:stress response protein SCP2